MNAKIQHLIYRQFSCKWQQWQTGNQIDH